MRFFKKDSPDTGTPSDTSSIKPGSADTDKPPLEKQPDDAPPADTAPDETANHLKGTKLVLLIAALCLCIFLVALDQTIIAPALGAITAEYRSVKDIVRPLPLNPH